MLFTGALQDAILKPNSKFKSALSVIGITRTRSFLEEPLTTPNPLNRTKTVIFDSCLEVIEEDSNTITEYTVDSSSDMYGNTVADNCIAKSKRITLRVILSDDAFIVQQALSTAANALTMQNPWQMIPDRLEQIQEWIDTKRVLKYCGHTTDIENVVIEKISRKWDSNTGNGVSLDLQLQKVTLVKPKKGLAGKQVLTKIHITNKPADTTKTSDKAQKRSSTAHDMIE